MKCRSSSLVDERSSLDAAVEDGILHSKAPDLKANVHDMYEAHVLYPYRCIASRCLSAACRGLAVWDFWFYVHMCNRGGRKGVYLQR